MSDVFKTNKQTNKTVNFSPVSFSTLFARRYFPHVSLHSWCRYCEEFIWGLGKQGYKCNVCKFPCHTRCLKKVPKDCMVVLPDGETIVQDTGERKRAFTREDRGKTLPSLLKHKRKNSIATAPPEIQHAARTQRMEELLQWLERALDTRNYKTADKFNSAINRKLQETPDGYTELEGRIRALQSRFETESSSQLAQSQARPDETEENSSSGEEHSESSWYSGSGSDEEPGSFGMAGGFSIEDL
mmetsp:Transcript_51833/g.130104  ORF Transcript_51833/g.130104 Transcript_51833/m.130104 type:complete len:243 (+) Transcript_51833:569-1297(+)